MKLLKISSISLLVLFSFVFVPSALAEVTATGAPTTAKTVVLATMNVQDAKIISQEGNTLNVSFNISNREGAQSGVKYSVKLLKQVDKKQTVVDEYVYPEVLSIGENTTVTKSIVYNAPANLDGKYSVMISTKNYSGLPLGTSNLGEITLVSSIETVEILPETCSVSLSSNETANLKLTEGAKAGTNDEVLVTCTIKNNGKEESLSTPVFKTFYRSIYGDEVPQADGKVSPILLQAGESKTATFTLPKVTVPQSYVTKVYLQTGEVSSNYILVNYTLSGLSATIQNFSLDKTSYKANDTAKISFFWTSSATKKEEASAITINANIVNKNDKACTAPVSQLLASVGFVEIPVAITRTCENPQVAIELKDASGNILDQKALAFEAVKKAGQNIFAGKSGLIMIIVFALLVIAGLFVSFKNIKKKDDNNNTISENRPNGHIDGSTLAIFFFIFMFGLALIPGGKVSADTLYVTGSDGSTVILDFNLDNRIYPYGDPITLSSSITYDKYGDCSTMNLDASTSNESQEIDFGGETIVCGGDELYSTNIFYTSSTASDSILISGSVVLSGLYPVSVSRSIPYTVSAPSTATVTVMANNVADQITITAGDSVDIRWSTENASGKYFDCTYTGGGTCGEPSYGNVYNYLGGTFNPITTTTYTVTERQ